MGWYWRSEKEVCSNEPVYGAPDEVMYDDRIECCKARFGSSRPSMCSTFNMCNPEPETPEPTSSPTPMPTPSPVVPGETPETTPEPTACGPRTWHFDNDKEICDNKLRDDDDDHYCLSLSGAHDSLSNQ